MASTVSNGNDSSEKWQRPFQMATTVYERKVSEGSTNNKPLYFTKTLSRKNTCFGIIILFTGLFGELENTRCLRKNINDCVQYSAALRILRYICSVHLKVAFNRGNAVFLFLPGVLKIK